MTTTKPSLTSNVGRAARSSQAAARGHSLDWMPVEPLADVPAMIATGEIRHGLVIAAFALAGMFGTCAAGKG